MKKLLLPLGAAFLLFAFVARYSAADLPKVIDAGVCKAAPTIDGVINTEEWRDAPVHTFDLKVIRFEPLATESRRAEMRIMNSANALYVAFKVPDSTVDNTLAPLMLDGAMLALCQGEKVSPHDDRKLIAEGLYRDKFVDAPGKGDGDDAHQDGRGAMTRQNGTCSFEWALPLKSTDQDDLKAKPGDAIRFNLAYFDAFQVPLTKTKIGGVYGVHLDQADEWGTLRLAANVKDDGGEAFQSPHWVKGLAQKIRSLALAGFQVTEDVTAPGLSATTGKLLATVTYRDHKGKEREAKAKLYFPNSVASAGSAKIPLFFAAGYELPDGAEQEYIKRGWAVISPRDVSPNPLVRTKNPDVALLHIARSLPWIDDRRVFVGGGSAGGWMTLLLAAETFPLAGAAPDVPPFNLGYNGAYFFKQLEIAGPNGGGTARIPAMFGVGTLLKPCQDVYGEQYDGANWFADSPAAQVKMITCPVSVYWTTADVLVPIDQVGAQWVQKFDESQFPPGFTMDPETLMSSREGRIRLVDVLPSSEYEVFTINVPPGTSRANNPASGGKPSTCELPVSARKRWSISIINEGVPIPDVDHRKYALFPTRNGFWKQVDTVTISSDQLSLTKLEQLMDRYAGKESLPSTLQHLDFPERERADVLRGLKTYASNQPANRTRLAELYSQLPAAKRVLEPDALQSLGVGR